MESRGWVVEDLGMCGKVWVCNTQIGTRVINKLSQGAEQSLNQGRKTAEGSCGGGERWLGD